MKKKAFPIVYFLVTATSAFSPAETPWQLTSGPDRVHLLELYTSEGCSSCPPADAYLRGLRADKGLFKTFVPVAYHVDYWNQLGWTDRYAQSSFADRQRAQASRWGKNGVYTPGFVLDGSEVGPSGKDSQKSMLRSAKVGTLSVSRQGNGFRVRFQPSIAGTRWTARAAVLGNGLSTAVASGENARTLLRHDFVALSTAEAGMVPSDNGFVATMTLPKQNRSLAREHSVVFWIEREGDPRPVQAAGSDVPAPFFSKESL